MTLAVLAIGLLGFTTGASAHFKNQPSRDCGDIRFSKRERAFDIRARAVTCKQARRIVRRFHQRNIANWNSLYRERSTGDRGSRRSHSDIGQDKYGSRKRVVWAYRPLGEL